MTRQAPDPAPDAAAADALAPLPLRPRGRPRKTADERDDGNRRREVLAAAAKLFRQQGFAATSTRDIAAAAGMRSGSPFYHFENKQALLAAVMLEGMRSALARQNQALADLANPDGEPDARRRLQALVRNQLEVLLGPDSDFIPVMLFEWRMLDQAQMGAINALKDAYEAEWIPVFQRLHADGALSGDPSIARLMVFGALNWTVQWYRPDARGERTGPQKPRARATLDDLTATALLLFLKEPA